jgi:hypothetical protein
MSAIVRAGYSVPLLLLVLIFAILLIALYVSSKGLYVPSIRRMAGLDAMAEAVGRATELGRPVHFVPGMGALSTEWAPQILAGLTCLGFTAEMCAKYNTRIIVSLRDPAVQAIAQDVVGQAFLRAGKPEDFKPDDIRFQGATQFGFASGVLGTMRREKIAANIMIGAFWVESLLFAEAGYQTGAIQIAGTAKTDTICYFMACCDYCLIGEEIFAVSAYLSRDKVQLGAIFGQDIVKAIVMGLMVVGVVLTTLGIPHLSTLLKT